MLYAKISFDNLHFSRVECLSVRVTCMSRLVDGTG